MTETKECQMCHQVFPIDNFYKRKDRNGEYTWKTSYCSKCDVEKVKESRQKNPEHYREYKKNYNNKYYHEHKDKVKIVQKRYYYNKLSFVKKIKYKQKMIKNFPEWADLICVN